MVASVSRRTLATDTAFSKATRTTFVGSIIPSSSRKRLTGVNDLIIPDSYENED